MNLRDHVKEDGLQVTTGKTGTRVWFSWDAGLTEVVERCKKARGKIRSTYLICTQEGQRYTGEGFRSAWQRLMRRALAERVIEERFTFNDIRAKHASDSQPEEATERLGHDDPRTTRRIYRRGPRQVHPLRPKIFGNR